MNQKSQVTPKPSVRRSPDAVMRKTPAPAPKTFATPRIGKPSAPAAYRPLPTPKVLQTKMHTQHQTANKVMRVAPAPYRPQPLPKVLQPKIPLVLQQKRTLDITPVFTMRAVIQRSKDNRRKQREQKQEGKKQEVIKVGKISLLTDHYHHDIKPAIIKAIGKQKLKQLLKTKDVSNADFYFEKDGTILVGPNGTGGKNGKDTGFNLFVLFPTLKPAEADVAPQGEDLDLPPDDDNSFNFDEL